MRTMSNFRNRGNTTHHAQQQLSCSPRRPLQPASQNKPATLCVAMQAEPPAVEVFTDYSQWERRPSTKSWTATGRGRVGPGRTTHSKTCRQDALKVAARLSQGSVVVDPAPRCPPVPHSSYCGHSNSKKTLAQPRQISTCITSLRRRIEKAKSPTVTARHSMDQVS